MLRIIFVSTWIRSKTKSSNVFYFPGRCRYWIESSLPFCWSKGAKSGPFPAVSLCHSDCISHCATFPEICLLKLFPALFWVADNALQWSEWPLRKPSISWQIAGKEILCKHCQDKFRSRSGSSNSFFSAHLHISTWVQLHKTFYSMIIR